MTSIHALITCIHFQGTGSVRPRIVGNARAMEHRYEATGSPPRGHDRLYLLQPIT